MNSLQLIELLQYYSWQFWLLISILLLSIELFGTALYAFWCSAVALFIALISFIFPLSIIQQWILFNVFVIITILWWWHWSQTRKQEISQAKLLNKPILNIIGNTYTLSEPIIDGYGRIKVGDGGWRVQCQMDLPIGHKVRIERIKGNTLEVTPVDE